MLKYILYIFTLFKSRLNNGIKFILWIQVQTTIAAFRSERGVVFKFLQQHLTNRRNLVYAC